MDLTVNQDSHVLEVKLLFGDTFPHVVRPVLAFCNLQKLSRGQRRVSGEALLGLLLWPKNVCEREREAIVPLLAPRICVCVCVCVCVKQ